MQLPGRGRASLTAASSEPCYSPPRNAPPSFSFSVAAGGAFRLSVVSGIARQAAGSGKTIDNDAQRLSEMSDGPEQAAYALRKCGPCLSHSKTVRGGSVPRGFESPPLRHMQEQSKGPRRSGALAVRGTRGNARQGQAVVNRLTVARADA